MCYLLCHHIKILIGRCLYNKKSSINDICVWWLIGIFCLFQLMELVPVSCTVRPSRAETPPPSLKRTKLEDAPPAVPTAAYYSALGMAPTLPNYMVDPFHYFYGPWVPPPAAMYMNNSHHLYRNERLESSPYFVFVYRYAFYSTFY